MQDNFEKSNIPNHKQITKLFFDNSTNFNIYQKNLKYSQDNNINYYSLSRNEGLSKAYNYCIKKILQKNVNLKKTWIMTLDQDTQISTEYFLNIVDSINEEDSYPLKTGKIFFNNFVGSPTELFDSTDRMSEVTEGKNDFVINATAINTALTIRLDKLQEIGLYNELIFLDMLDHLLMYQLKNIGLNKIQIVAGALQQDFSGDSFGSCESDFSRFKIYEKDLKKYYELTDMKYSKYLEIYLKRGLKLSWHHRKNFFKKSK